MARFLVTKAAKDDAADKLEPFRFRLSPGPRVACLPVGLKVVVKSVYWPASGYTCFQNFMRTSG